MSYDLAVANKSIDVCTGVGGSTCKTYVKPDEVGAASKCMQKLDAKVQQVQALEGFVAIVDKKYKSTFKGQGPITSQFECDVDVKYSRYRQKKDPLCGCASWEYPACWARHDTCDAEGAFSATGLTKSLFDQAHPEALTGTAVCTTCEHLPVTDEASIHAKFDCLRTRLESSSIPDGADGQKTKSTLISFLKLVYELYGDRLGASERAYLRDLYSTYGETLPSCGVSSVVAVSADCVDSVEEDVRSTVGYCQRMTSSHVVPFVAHEAGFECSTLLPEVAAGADETCSGEYVDSLSETAQQLVEASFERLERDEGTDSLVNAREGLALLDYWYRQLRGVTSQAEAQGRLSRAVAAFWLNAYRTASALPGEIPDGVDEGALNALFGKSLWADRQVLLAAFSDQQPITSEALFLVLADGLRGLVERLDQASRLHDTACRLRGCSPATVSTEATELWRILAALPNREALQAALASAPHVRVSYAALFAKVRDNYEALELAFADATGQSAEDLAQLPTATAPILLDTQAAIGLAEARWRSFASTGFLGESTGNLLRTGMQRSKRELVKDAVNAGMLGLDAAIKEYKDTRSTVLNGLLAQLRNESERDAVLHRLAQASERVQQLSADLNGLRQRHAWEQLRFAGLGASLDELMTSGAVDPNMLVSQKHATITTRAADAAYQHDQFGWLTISDIVAGQLATARQVGAGERVSISVSGTWAPTCALSKASIASPYGQLVPVQIVDAQTGPEGYWVEWSNGGYRSRSNHTSSESFKSHTETEQTCWGKSVSLSGSVGAGSGSNLGGSLGPSLSASSTSCTETSVGSRQSAGTSSGTGYDSRYGASFSSGLRLAKTPFPDAPAGALLLVALRAGAQHFDDVVDVQVVRRSSDFVFDRDVDVYLVVNDDGSCAPEALSSSTLTVDLVISTPLGKYAKALAGAMASSLADIGEQFDSILAQGSISSAESSALRNQAYTNLSIALGADVGGFPSVLRGFFESWIDAQLASLERRARMLDIERSMRLIALDARAAGRDLAAAGDQSRLLSLGSYWAMRDLSSRSMELGMDGVLASIDQYLTPMLRLVYPNVLQDLKTKAASELDALLHLDFTSSVDAYASKVKALNLPIQQALTTMQIEEPETAKLRLAVAFPRTPVFSDLFGGGTWITVDASRSQQLWAELEQTGIARFQIRAEDIYKAGGGNGVIGCINDVPVIQAMGIYGVKAGSEAGSESGMFTQVEGTVDPVSVFAHPDGALSYTMANPAWLEMNARIAYGTETSALADFESYALVEGAGLSPISTFHVNMANVPPGTMADLTSLIVTFEVEVRKLAGGLFWLPNCQ